MDGSVPQGDDAPLPTRFAYSLLSQLFAAGFAAVVAVPAVYVIAFLATHLQDMGMRELGGALLITLFLLAAPTFVLLRYGHYFCRFEVEPQRLVIVSLGRRSALEWRQVTRVVRRTRSTSFTGSAYKVRVEFGPAAGKRDWIALFDSALPGADDLYRQVVRHVPHIRPKEIEDL